MTPTQPPQGVVAELRELLARRSDAAERIARSPINLDDVQAYQDADTAACTAALLVLPGLLDDLEVARHAAVAMERSRNDVHARAERLSERASALLARCEGLEAAASAYIGLLESCVDGYYKPEQSDEAKAWLAATRTTGDGS